MKNILITIFTSIIVSLIVLFMYITIVEINEPEIVENEDSFTQSVSHQTEVNSDVETVYEDVVNGVVYVETNVYGSLSGSGSGFVYKIEDGYAYILTNQHVVEAGTSFVIKTNEENVIEEVEYLGGDSDYDVAVLRAKTTDDLIALEVADVNDSGIGETVLAIGSPLGEEYINTATLGILSGKDRYVVADEFDLWGLMLMQTDTAINPGNSGGPLFTMDGRVIGINSLKFSRDDVEGMGFAIPVYNLMRKVGLLENGESIKPSVGVTIYEDGSNLVVRNALNGGAAASAGVKSGDIITEVNGNEITDLVSMRKALYDLLPGDEVSLIVNRNGEQIELSIVLGNYEN